MPCCTVSYYTGEAYACRDNHALITHANWVVFCPPTDEVIPQSQMYDDLSNLSSTSQTGTYM